MERLESLSDTLAELLTGFPDVVIVLDEFGRVKWATTPLSECSAALSRTPSTFSALELVHPEDLELRHPLPGERQAQRGRDAHRGSGPDT